MLPWERPVFDSAFELWREQGVLQLVVPRGAHLRTSDMKELIRLVKALDPGGAAPVLMECGGDLRVDDDARRLLGRACGRNGHPVALFTMDLACRMQAETFLRLQRPYFPFKLFAWREDAVRWVRERVQRHALAQGPAVENRLDG
jgi:hypothetical protein